MRFKRILSAILLLALCVTSLTGCVSIREKDSSKAFIQSVIDTVNLAKDPVEWLSGTEWQNTNQLTATPRFQPYFYIADVRLTESAENPDAVHYTCTVPGLVGAAFNMLLTTCIRYNDQHSARVPLEGDLTVVTAADGKRKIDISAGKDPLSLYVALRYMDTSIWSMFGDIDISDGIGEDEFNLALNIMLSTGSIAYARALGMEQSDYSTQTVIPELKAYIDSFSTFGYSRSEHGYGFVNFLLDLPLIVQLFLFLIGLMIALFALWGLALLFGKIFRPLYNHLAKRSLALRDKRTEQLHRQVQHAISRKNAHPIRLLNRMVKLDTTQSDRLMGHKYGQYTFKAYCQTMSFSNDSSSKLRRWFGHSDNTGVEPILPAVLLAENPSMKAYALAFLCKNIHFGVTQNAKPSDIAAAGWSAAALGRAIALQMKAEDIAASMKAFSSLVDEFNQFINNARQMQLKLPELKQAYETASREERTKDKKDRNPSRLKAMQKACDQMERELKSAAARINNGLGAFMLDHGEMPLWYLLNILFERQHNYPRFVRQGIIMGLIDWVTLNKAHPEAQKLLDRLVQARANLISSDDKLSFFEVRVPDECTPESYAALLADVLHCANPSIRYCDTNILMSVAVQEIPEVMSLLIKYPLRLIDPANRQTLGFYEFKPFEHALWVQYQPPMNVGPVVDRYHEVLDMTVPLSSGLNLRLFTNPYAVIPTLYHEYTHYKGDPNEASVFLKTQVFSQHFYRQYPDADPKADPVFVQLQLLLGNPPSPDKAAALNALIEKYYGKPMSKEQARQHAMEVLANLNLLVNSINEREKWCPSIPFPALKLSSYMEFMIDPKLNPDINETGDKDQADGDETDKPLDIDKFMAKLMDHASEASHDAADSDGTEDTDDADGSDDAGDSDSTETEPHVDHVNADLIYQITVRYAQVPRSITQDEFRDIVRKP